MNDPLNRFWWPSTAPFGANVGSPATPPSPSGGILGNLGQNIETPRMDSRPATTASDVPRLSVNQLWDYPWPYRSPLDTYDSETLKFHTAWGRLYSPPLLPAAWPPTSPSQSRTPFGLSVQSLPAPAPDFSSAPDVPGQSPTAAPDPDGWRRSASMASLQPNGARNFAPPMAPLNFANYSGAAPPPSRMNTGPMPESDYSLSPAPFTPSWDPIPSRTTARGAGFFPEVPSRSSVDRSVNVPDARQTTDAQSPPEILSDVTPDNQWIPGADYAADGHHYFPRANYKGKRALEKGEMSPETRKVFDEAKTGRLRVHSINGRRHEYDEFHRLYEDATDEILEQFIKEKNIPIDAT